MPSFEFSRLGLAGILAQYDLVVPPNQRDYSWTTKEVTTLFQDFARAISDDDPTYFVGTIVTIPRVGRALEVVDGQQRLATTAIMLAEIRNYLADRDTKIAQSVESQFLTVIDRPTRESVPRLRLNLDDNDYFRARLTNADPTPAATKPSHDLIDHAFRDAANQVQQVVSGFHEKDHGNVLNRWIDFIETQATAVLLRVPTDADAYRMFETLNDRGLRTSQADLVKNYLFGRAGTRIDEAQQKWAQMRGALETIEDDDLTIRFLRHALTLIHGFVREQKVYSTVQDIAKAPQPVVTFSGDLETLAATYVAIFNSEHETWNRSVPTRKAVEVLNLLDVKPLRPLVLAIAHRFSDKEVDRAMPFCVSLAVRLVITTSTRTGSVETGLATAANSIYIGQILSTKDLKKQLQSITPSDSQFLANFQTATVSNGKLARYYLRSMELCSTQEQEPWHIPNDNPSDINLEHVLPQNPQGNWPQFTSDQAKLYYKRIGNLCLLRASENSGAHSDPFVKKRGIFADSAYNLTKQIASSSDWTDFDITKRQTALADLAVKTWPL